MKLKSKFISLKEYIPSGKPSLSQFEIKEHIGVVQGSTVRGRNVGADIFANLKNVIGGEIVSYSKLLVASREQAYERMIIDAKSKGANAVVAFRFQTSNITQGASEVLAYGTGVRI